MGKVVELVFLDPECNREGLNFLDRLLHNNDTNEAGNLILVSVLTDPRFIQASNVYGTDLIAHVI
jgi:hypothetical protein